MTDFPGDQANPGEFASTTSSTSRRSLSRDKSRMLLRLDLSNVPASRGLHLNGDYPLAWAKMYGKGRVFYDRARTRPARRPYATCNRCILRPKWIAGSDRRHTQASRDESRYCPIRSLSTARLVVLLNN